MSAGYDTKCRCCGAQGGVISDYVTLRQGEEEVGLPHPAEEKTLKELGLTWDKAASRGRLLRYEGRLCRSCGEVFYVKSVAWPNGQLPGLMVFVIAGICLGFALFAWWGVASDLLLAWLLFFTTALAFLAHHLILGALFLGKVRRRFGCVPSNACSRCGSDDTVDALIGVGREKLAARCSKCGERACKVGSIWMS